MAQRGLALLVGTHRGKGGLVGGLVVLHRDEGAHATHGMGAAAVAHAHHMGGIGGHEGHLHGHLRPVGQQLRGVFLERLDIAEDIVPTAAVQRGDVIAQFIEDLLGHEGAWQRLDQHGGADGAQRQVEHGLGGDEDIVPQPGFEAVLQLGQIEIGAAALGQQRLGIVEEIEAEIEDGAGHAFAIDQQMRLIQMPAARPADEHGGLFIEPVALALVLEADGAGHRVAQIDLALHHHVPGGGGRILKAGHEAARAAVQRIDHHLAVAWARDLDAPVGQIGRCRAHLPRTVVADGAIFRGKADEAFLVDPRLALISGAQQALAGGLIHAVKLRNEGQRLGREDGLVTGLHRALDLDTGKSGVAGHLGRPFIHR